MKVYRVEYDDGVGPYQTELANIWEEYGRCRLSFALTSAHDNPDTHPVAQIPWGVNQLCGFRSMQDLFRWFGGWLPLLIRCGARVAVYSIEPSSITYEDKHQIAFERK
jgi:hypothetical protein